MFKYLLSLFFQSLGKLLGVIRKVTIVFTVLGAIIFLFIFFLQKNEIKQQNVNTTAIYREQLYANIEFLKQDTSEIGQTQLKVYRKAICTMVGEACTENPSDGDVNYPSSFFGKLSGYVAAPYSHPPASGIAWVDASLQKAGFVPETYAATGLGFASLQGYMGIWKLFRDISYLLLVLVVVVVGFLIMFRVNAGGQTAVGIENALPRIVIAMIMITFSFPIAGFLIDMMYGLIAISVGLLYDAGYEASTSSLFNTPASSKEYLNEYLTAHFWTLWPDGANPFGVASSLWALAPNWIQFSVQALVLPIATGYAATLLKPVQETLASFNNIQAATFSLGNIPNLPYVIILTILIGVLTVWGPTIILGLIILLTILTLIFRIFFILLSSYIKILLYIIFGPIILMFSAIPGNGSIGWWLKNLVAELSTFPTVIVITLVGNAIVKTNMGESGLISNPFNHMIVPMFNGNVESFRLPFLYGFSAADFNLVISLGLVLLIPDIIKMVKGWIGVSESPLNVGLGTFLSGAAILTGGAGLGMQFQGFKQQAVGQDPSKGWMDNLGFMSPIATWLRGKAPPTP